MKKILITESGRATGINVTRCLRLAPEPLSIVGLEKSKFAIFNSEADRTFLMPDASKDKDGFLRFLQYILQKEKPDLLYPAKTNEALWEISKNREVLDCNIFLPDKEKIDVFEDKFRTSQLWQECGITIPRSMMIHNEQDLKIAFSKISKKLWLRNITGCGGKGAIDTDDFELARAWINRYAGWGAFMAAECLSDKTASWSAIWENGNLIVSQVRKRLFWEFPYLAPSGVTGITGAQYTACDSVIDEIAMKAVLAADPKPHGIISIDFTYDLEGVPNPTEIQASRFFTSMFFLAKAGLNFPYILLKLASKEEIPAFSNKYSPLEPGLVWIKYIEKEPVLTTLDAIEKNVNELDTTMAGLAKSRS